MNVVSFGGGTNSTAMLIGMKGRGIKPDLILFADTGAEMPHTYEHINAMNVWLKKTGWPEITVLQYFTRESERMTLECECLNSKTLPSIAYGFKRCSLKHKKSVQDKFCNNFDKCKEVWAGNGKSGKVSRFIGFDADEEGRMEGAEKADAQDKKYKHEYPLIEWGWGREKCVRVIKSEGMLPPGKSSCFFCPNMKKHEIFQLKQDYPELLKRAIAIEDNAIEGLTSVKGLGRNWAWRDLIYGDPLTIPMCGMTDNDDIPCGCYDG